MRLDRKLTMATDAATLEAEMREALATLNHVYSSEPFRALLDELWSLPPGQLRQRWVKDVLLNESTRNARGVLLPDGVEIQRTYFDDDRPTLFALVSHLPPDKDLTWEKVTITIDDVDSRAPEGGSGQPAPTLS